MVETTLGSLGELGMVESRAVAESELCILRMSAGQTVQARQQCLPIPGDQEVQHCVPGRKGGRRIGINLERGTKREMAEVLHAEIEIVLLVAGLEFHRTLIVVNGVDILAEIFLQAS